MTSFVISGTSTVAQTINTNEFGLVTATGVLYSATDWPVTVNGGYLEVAGHVMGFTVQLISGAVIVDEGGVISANGNGILSLGGRIVNSGTISGTSAGILADTTYLEVENHGMISGGLATSSNASGEGWINLLNTGTITGGISAGTFSGLAKVTLNNSGTISGLSYQRAIQFLNADDLLVNRGTIFGETGLGGGADRFDGATGLQGAVFGEGGHDTILGGAGMDTLYGGTENDLLRGNGGDDALFGDGGRNQLYGGTGDDTLTGGSDWDTLTGGDGNDLIGDVGGRNTIDGQAGDDTITGGAGNDIIRAGSGDDSTFGGLGADTVLGGDGIDVVWGDAGNDFVQGNLGDDTVLGQDGDDWLYGHGGDDGMDGGTGNDLVYGGAGDDTMSGGDGNDQIVGGAGNDTLSGNAGTDRFVFNLGAGNDTIMDFQVGVDRVDLTAFNLSSYSEFAALAEEKWSTPSVIIDLTSLGGGIIRIVGVQLTNNPANLGVPLIQGGDILF